MARRRSRHFTAVAALGPQEVELEHPKVVVSCVLFRIPPIPKSLELRKLTCFHASFFSFLPLWLATLLASLFSALLPPSSPLEKCSVL